MRVGLIMSIRRAWEVLESKGGVDGEMEGFEISFGLLSLIFTLLVNTL